ncbi:MAG: VanZ family protein [Pseudomonadota bacterium]
MGIWVRRWGPAVVMMALIFIASATPGPDLPYFGFWDSAIKKGGHMLGYAFLAAAYIHGLTNGKKILRLHFILSVCLATLYSVVDEFHQGFTSGRTSSAVDVLIDTAGAGLGLGMWAWIRTFIPGLHGSANV